MRRHDFHGKRVLVLGLGLHGGGLSITKWLFRQGAEITVADLKTRSELGSSLRQLRGLPIKYVLGRHPLSLLRGCQMIVQNPAVPADLPLLRAARRLGIAIENEASLFIKLCPTNSLIAVTGTRGKSTTVSLLGAILKRGSSRTVVAGNIRDTLLFDILDKLNERSRVVLELSSWQLEVVGRQQLRLPHAVITNILPDHLNRYASLADYIKAKTMIFKYQRESDTLVLNFDNPVTRKLAKLAAAKVYWFSVKQPVRCGCFIRQGNMYWRHGAEMVKVLSVRTMALAGEHNLANMLAAATAALLAGASISDIRWVARHFRGLHDRLELIREFRGVKYFNDTTATSPDAVIAALKTLGRPVVLIAGGSDKNLQYGKMAAMIKKQVAAVILLPGTATAKLQRSLRVIGYDRIFLANDMNSAVLLATVLSPRPGQVLLSPGAASFGLFKHEFDRGNKFRLAVSRLR